MDKIYIFGHKKPDTDSVTAAISLSYLKNQIGFDTVPMVLGEVNNETKFVLDYFHVPVPNYLNDVKLQIKDLDYKKEYFVYKLASIFNTYHYMNDKLISNVPIIDEKKHFLGTASMKDIAKDMISGNYDTLYTSYDNILDALNGKELLRFDEEIRGNIIVASYKSTTFMENVQITPETILIVGDRHSIIEYAVMNGAKMLILTGSSHIKEEHLEIARKNHVNIIKTDYFSFKVARLISLSNYVGNIIFTRDVIAFRENDYVNDFVDTANKTKYSYFPVLDDNDRCLGILKLANVADKKKKKVILVDHNHYEQSVDGLDEAEIVEIVDHHNIGTLGTSMPINFRNMPLGSTNTIIYLLYKENQVTVPKDIAGLMLSGILSDTLLFASPTTTKIDREVVEELSKIAELDYTKFAMEMFKAGSSLKGKTCEEILYTDFKNFTIDGKKVGVSQISTVNVDEIEENAEQYIELIDKIAENNDYYILALFVTDILHNGSYVYFNKGATDILDNCFGIPNMEQGTYLEGVVSRKKQVIPNIMAELEK